MLNLKKLLSWCSFKTNTKKTFYNEVTKIITSLCEKGTKIDHITIAECTNLNNDDRRYVLDTFPQKDGTMHAVISVRPRFFQTAREALAEQRIKLVQYEMLANFKSKFTNLLAELKYSVTLIRLLAGGENCTTPEYHHALSESIVYPDIITLIVPKQYLRIAEHLLLLKLLEEARNHNPVGTVRVDRGNGYAYISIPEENNTTLPKAPPFCRNVPAAEAIEPVNNSREGN